MDEKQAGAQQGYSHQCYTEMREKYIDCQLWEGFGIGDLYGSTAQSDIWDTFELDLSGEILKQKHQR